MVDTPNIEGLPDPRKASEIQGDNSVDPEKFRRILKVDESDETEKRNQRQKPKKQEEEEELDPSLEEELIPTGEAFAAYLREKKKSETIFEPKEGALQEVNPTNEIAAPANLLEPSKSEDDKASLKIVPSSETSPDMPRTKSDQASESIKTEGLAPQADYVDTSFITPPQDQKIIQTSPSTLTPEEKTIEEPSATASLMKEKHKEEAKEEAATFTPQQTEQVMMEGPPILNTETPAYTSFTPELFDLFERMLGYMVIEESKGISITTIKLSMPGSIFNDCEITLEHYDTAPSAFNVQLLGNPQAVDLFTSNLQDLTAAFAMSNYSFDVHLRKPALLTEYRHLVDRKTQVVGDESSKKETAN